MSAGTTAVGPICQPWTVTAEGPNGGICCPPVLEAALSEEEAGELADVLKALADPARLRVLSMIAAAPSGEVCACDLSGPLRRSQPTVSHHLAQLVRAGLVRREQRGKWAWFRVDLERLAELRTCLSPPPGPSS